MDMGTGSCPEYLTAGASHDEPRGLRKWEGTPADTDSESDSDALSNAMFEGQPAATLPPRTGGAQEVWAPMVPKPATSERQYFAIEEDTQRHDHDRIPRQKFRQQ
uniref:Uncharacterized protein n=1 Tax=Heliothis virescens TaxID=7102 RepID=A0A2A4K489_HELVI